jgi:hypothetical protein
MEIIPFTRVKSQILQFQKNLEGSITILNRHGWEKGTT